MAEQNVYEGFAAMVGSEMDRYSDATDSKEKQIAFNNVKEYVTMGASELKEDNNYSLRVEELNQKRDQLEFDKYKLKTDTQNSNRKLVLEYVKLGVGVATTVGVAAFTAWFQVRGAVLEETGSITTTFGRTGNKIAESLTRRISKDI